MINQLAQFLTDKAGLDFATWGIWIVLILRFTLAATAFLGGISVIAMFSTWWERKVAAHMQSRLGPMHVGGWHGWAQPIADGIKLFLKEDLVPEGADGMLFRLAPYLAFAPVFAAFLALPFGPQFVFEASFNIGVLYLLAVLAVEVMGVILAGWASNSKWSIYGAMREACQMVSYEIPMGLAIICGVLTAGTLDLMELGYLQGRGMWDWFIFHSPFAFGAFVLYFIASLASNKRAPFDLPESESELVAGFHTEYSGLRWSFFFMAEYGSMFVIGAIQAALFLGAWNSPFGQYDYVIYHWIGYDPVAAGHAYFDGRVTGGIAEQASAMGLTPVGLIVLNLYSLFWFVFKAMGVIFVQMWLRWTLPRIRIDQVLHTCVKVLLPASLVMLVGTAVWIWLVPQPAGVEIQGQMVQRLGHLVGPEPAVQLITQVVLTLLGLGVAAACVAVVAWAWLHREKATMKTFFPDVMPVGDQISFNPGKGGPAEKATPAPAAGA